MKLSFLPLRIISIVLALVVLGNSSLSTALMQRTGAVTTSIAPAEEAGRRVVEQPAQATGSNQHLLIDRIDLLALGDVDAQVVVPENTLETTITATTSLSTTWEEARATTLLIGSKEPASSAAALLDSASYKFNSPKA